MLYILFYFTGFFSIIIYSLTNHNIYVFKVLSTILVSMVIIIAISRGVGGDVENYERYFYGLRLSRINDSNWLLDYFKLFIKWVFDEANYEGMPLKSQDNFNIDMLLYNQYNHYGFKFYQICTSLVFIAGVFTFINSIAYRNNNISKLLILLLPVSMTMMVIAIEQAISLGVVFFALSRIHKSKLYFLILIMLSGFLHWSSWLFLPIVFYDKRLFQIILILTTSFILLLQIFNIQLLELIINTFYSIPNFLKIDFFQIAFEENVLPALGYGSKDFVDYNRNISWHHIYLSAFLVLCSALFHIKFQSSLNLKNQKNSILLISILILLLIVSFIFKDIDNYVVRIGALIKIFSLLLFVNAVYILNIQTRLIIILLSLNFTFLGIYSFY